MYRFIFVGFLSVFAIASQAQGYVGAVASLSSIGIDCANKLTCDKKGFGARFYAGSKLSAENQIDFQFGKIDAFEVGVSNFGKASSTYIRTYTITDVVNGGTTTQDRTISTVGTANALTFAAVANMPVTTELAVLAKLGVAYVSSTARYYVDGVANASETETKLKPYLGLGASMVVFDSLKIVGNYDVTAFDVAGRKSRASSFGLGAEMSF